MKAIILAAGMGTRLGKYTENLPKCMLDFNGETLIKRQIQTLNSAGITDIVVVGGYMFEKMKLSGVKYLVNENYENTNMVETLFVAEEEMNEDILVCYADILYEPRILKKILENKSDIGVCVDEDYWEYWDARMDNPEEDMESLIIDNGKIIELGDTNCEKDKAKSRYVGLIKFSKKGVEALKEVYHENKEKYFNSGSSWMKSKSFKKAYMTCMLQALINKGYLVNPITISRGWIEFDNVEDYERAIKWFNEGSLSRFINLEKKKKVFVLGIDGAMPETIFNDWIDELPNMKKLMQKGCHARLNSTTPPVSVVAWTSMTTGKCPSDHGIFECIYRKGNSYDQSIITSRNVMAKRVWDIVEENNKKTINCLVPLTWPLKPTNEIGISGFMTPLMKDIKYTYPENLKQEIEDFIQEPFLIEQEKYRDLSKEELLESITNITKTHLRVIKYLIKQKNWDLFFSVLIGSDRLNHGFWRYCDKTHRKYVKGNKFENTLKEFYKMVDKNLGEILNLLDENTTIIIVSDHGIQKMDNRVNLTDWLIQNNYMVLKQEIELNNITKFETSMVDWEKTKVFVRGAFDAQIFVNLIGREPNGHVHSEDYDSLIEELAEKLKQIKGDEGKELNTKTFKKKDYFQGKCSDSAPDLLVYFDNLNYGTNTSLIGNPTLWSPRTSAGSDDAAHSKQGIFIMDNKKVKGDLNNIDILDITPTILNELNIKIPEDITGNIIGLRQ